MFKKTITTVLCMTMLLAFPFKIGHASTAFVNPPRTELEERVEAVARKRGIPSVLLKSIARVESVYKQFNSDGSVFTGSSGSIGLMQIYNKYGWFENEKLKYDIDYNIEAGADVLLRKWDLAVETLPQIGDMNPNILENWYFAIWAYNGWSKVNNPNTGLKKQTFQELVYYIAEKEYGQVITPIDNKLLPKQGLPSKDKKYETPQELHYGDILTYAEGDIVKLDGRHVTKLKDAPNGSNVAEVNNLMELQVLEGPVLSNGYFWYKVRANEINAEGWLVGNWISKTGSIYPFLDIAGIWAKDYIIKLHEMDIVSGSGGNFNPDDHITRQEISVMLSKALQLEPVETIEDIEAIETTEPIELIEKDESNEPIELIEADKSIEVDDQIETDETIQPVESIELIDQPEPIEVILEYADASDIKNWAIEHVFAVTEADIIPVNEETNEFKPNEYISREEAAIIISNAIGYEEELDFELQYIDVDEISEETLNAIKNVQIKGIMTGSNGTFRPKDYLTRGEACKLIFDLLNIMEYEN